jgi:hypothetical protein
MKLFENTCDFHYPWEQVTAANWRKYPNEVSTHVVAVDVLRRELDLTSTVLTTERLITCKQSIPSWLQYIVGGKNVSYVREVSVVDLNDRTLTLRSVNLTMCHLLKVFETVRYTPDTVDPYKTVFKQEAQITAYGAFQRVCNKIEDWSLERFHQNAQKGKAGFDGVLKLFNEQWNEFKQMDILKQVDHSLDKVVAETEKITKEIVQETEKIKNDLVHETEKITRELVQETEKIKNELVKETDKILEEAVHVKKSILTQYYDIIKNAFKRD